MVYVGTAALGCPPGKARLFIQPRRAADCSPRRKPWVSEKVVSPEGAKDIIAVHCKRDFGLN